MYIPYFILFGTLLLIGIYVEQQYWRNGHHLVDTNANFLKPSRANSRNRNNNRNGGIGNAQDKFDDQQQNSIPFDPKEHPHRRFNPLTGEFVLVSPHRTKRPWKGKVEMPPKDERPKHDASCNLCPGNLRANGERNPNYTTTFVFDNDFAALMPNTPPIGPSSEELLHSEAIRGTCRVMCFSPRHDLTLPELELPEIRAVIDAWAHQVTDLSPKYKWVQVFENKGEIMGCSNPHPHGQIWAEDELPNEALKEDENQYQFWIEHEQKTTLLLDYLRAELESNGERIIEQNSEWVALVPYWAIWPFEMLLIPKRHTLHIPDLDEKQRDELSIILKSILTRYDNLFNVSFPYSMGWHGAPFPFQENSHWQLHAHFYPPLLRSATVKKFMVGYELMAEAQRDLTAEQAAQQLKSLPTIHYKQSDKN